MPNNFLHNHPSFSDLFRVLDAETGILPQLIEKDYWIMHVLHGLKLQGFDFQLKGGTSLSKGFKIIDRFSEFTPDCKWNLYVIQFKNQLIICFADKKERASLIRKKSPVFFYLYP